ncbi:PIG-L family deacetylase [Pseudomonas sp. CBSPBW29]|uniref:PIG-L deacetylase family protein n=1 Tax=Pseudomonas sp. CBS TaxID=2971912 RepID=UPI0021ABA1CC|nr:PIG-L family deacetylase [Pseudomonas sp. CBS]WEL45397.1 PIG-L family deacetylase [Pseudomonas sp. CBSPBW29]WEL66500.1 PIG-L family deacetylase [Pseudomonas sp. CBSPGW29]WEL69987.1 PIG-L family deacetylase [Pseudomonas sp. CBSPCGW29]WEL76941.1 PIG-L family deacetylase [Pseudomonas sp. CBSPAW29]WEL84454.1 PIG-L family deacetylase [Pseudomonas sp. CBSPCAW29]WEL87281.1 PIG-L family deacetylase [Pseudomonas sp. CBSPCBW29]
MSLLSLESMMGKRILLLSPHADDVAYSIGGIVARLSMRANLRLMTIFGYSGWALPQASCENTPDAVSAEREREDRAYCARRRIAYDLLSYPDSFVMGYDTAAELSIAANEDSRTDQVVNLIRNAVARWEPQVVIAPCGIGGHVDHQIVRVAADALHHIEVLYYEDVPYSSSFPLLELERQLTVQGLVPAMTADIDVVVQRKCEDMWGYRSQTSASTVSEMLLHAGRVSTATEQYAERLWRRLN